MRAATSEMRLAVLGLLLLGGASGCGPPDADPGAALLAICPEGSTILDENGDVAEAGDPPPLSCSVYGHRAEVKRYEHDAEQMVRDAAEEFESGNGDQAAWAFLDTGDGSGVVVYLFPTDGEVGTREPDLSLLDPLADEGWEVGES